MTHRTTLNGTKTKKTKHNYQKKKINNKQTIINKLKQYQFINNKQMQKENVSLKIKYGNMFVIKNIPVRAYNIHNFRTRFFFFSFHKVHLIKFF